MLRRPSPPPPFILRNSSWVSRCMNMFNLSCTTYSMWLWRPRLSLSPCNISSTDSISNDSCMMYDVQDVPLVLRYGASTWRIEGMGSFKNYFLTSLPSAQSAQFMLIRIPTLNVSSSSWMIRLRIWNLQILTDSRPLAPHVSWKCFLRTREFHEPTPSIPG